MSLHGEREKKVHGGTGVSGLSAALKASSIQAALAEPDSNTAVIASPQQQQLSWSLGYEQQLYRPVSTSLSAGKLSKSFRPFLSCFSGGLEAGSKSVQQMLATEVGIRPSFYWLDAEISAEERDFAEESARWMKSDCQDDVVVLHNFASQACQIFAGVFDGHGPFGRGAAKYASTQIPALLSTHSAMANRASDKKRLRAMKEACEIVDSCMKDEDVCGFDATLSGTTACFAILWGRKVYLANTGDSRCVLGRRTSSGNMEAIQMTWDAKPNHPDELHRIRSAGGVVSQLCDDAGERVGAHRVFRRGDDVLPGLAMSRSLGDLYAHAVGVINEPALSTYSLGDKDLFLVLGTDGLWDIMSNGEVVDFIERYRNGRAQDLTCAEALTLEAQERWKARHSEALVDDISVAIIHLAPLGPVNEAAHVRSPLAHAASCNDEANALYQSWASHGDRNPSHHAPRRYFSHLYDDSCQEEAPHPCLGDAGGGGQASICSVAAPHTGVGLCGDAQQAGERPQQGAAASPRDHAARAGTSGAAPSVPCPADSSAEGEMGGGAEAAPQFMAAGGGSRPGVLHIHVPHAQAAMGPPPVRSHPPPLPASPEGSSLACIALDASPPLSPRSCMDCSEGSEHDHFRDSYGSQATGAFSTPPHPTPEFLGAKQSSPIPCRSPPDDPLLRPIRKAYPSQNCGLSSYKSNASMLDTQDTPRSTEGGGSRGSGQSRNFSYEGKLRGGLPRTTSAPILAHVARNTASLDLPALSSSMRAISLDERGQAQLALCQLSASPADSFLASPCNTTSPMPPPLAASPHPHPHPHPSPIYTPHSLGSPYSLKPGASSSLPSPEGLPFPAFAERELRGVSGRGLLRSVSEVGEPRLQGPHHQ